MRCVVADDHPAIVDAVSRYLEGEEGVTVVGTASDGEQALALIETTTPDVALLDIRMPGLDGIAIARHLCDRQAATSTVLYTGHGDRPLLLAALDAGARGFLLKEAPLPDIVRALRTVAAGRTYVDPALASVLVTPEATDRLPSLTKREREILRLLADGMRNENVARQLFISPLTVRTHVKNAMTKLEADTRTEAVASALRQSLIS